MTGGQSGLTGLDEQIQSDLMTSANAFGLIRAAVGLSPNISEYTPQIGRETMAAQARILTGIPLVLTNEGRANEIYRRISPNLPAGYKAQLDADPTAKAAFLQMFQNAQTYVSHLDRVHAASTPAGPTPGPMTTANSTYSAAQLTAVRDAMRLVSTAQVPASFDQQTAAAAVTSLRDNARQVATSLRVDMTRMGDATIGQAILDKLAQERQRYLAANADATEAQFAAHMRQTFGVADVSAVSKVGTAMTNVAASGALAVTVPAPAGGGRTTPPQEIVPDQRTVAAMNVIRTQVMPAIDLRPSGTDNAAFRNDFAAVSRKLAQMFNVSGDPNSREVQTQIRAKLEELATNPQISTLRDLASLPVGAGAAFRAAVVGSQGQAGYDRLPQAIKDNPSMLFTLLDNRNNIFGSIDQIYASNILAQPTVTVARTNDGGTTTTTTPDPGATPGGATTTTPDAAVAQATQLLPQVRALATALQVPMTEQVTPDLAQTLAGALQQDRVRYGTQNAGATDAQYLGNLAFRMQMQGLTQDQLNQIMQAANTLSADAAARASASATASNTPSGPPTESQVRAASVVVETALMRLGSVAQNLGGGGGAGGLMGGLNISALAGFAPPTQADGEFDQQSQNALHMVVMGLKKLGGDNRADGTYTAAVGQRLMADILTKPAFAMIREQYGITGTYTPAQVANMQTFMSRVGQEGGVSQADKEKVEELQALFESLNVLERANKLNNERAREVTFMGTVMDRIGQFLPNSFKNFLRDFFEGSQFGKMLGGILSMFGFPVQRLWGGQAPGGQAVREQVRDVYRRELEEAGFDHALLKTRILERMDDSLAFKAAERLLFQGADRGTIRREVEGALDRAAQESNPDRAAEVFAEELVRRGEQYQQMSPAQREEYVRQVREAYEQEVRTMPGVPTDGGTTPRPGATTGGGATTTAQPNYTAAHLAAVSSGMSLVGLTVPAAGLDAAGATAGIQEIRNRTLQIATRLGIDTNSATTSVANDSFGRLVEERIAAERTRFFGANADATEGQYRDHMKTLGIEDIDAANRTVRAYRDVHASGAMNLGVAPTVTVARTTDGGTRTTPGAGGTTVSTSPAADAVSVEVGDKRYEITFTPNNAEFVQGPMRYSHGRVAVLQNIMSQNSAALELATVPGEYMRPADGRAPDMMTRNTSMALEELLIRSQLAKGVEPAAISRRYDNTTIPMVADYMRSKGLNEQDITRFTDTVRDLRTDMKSTSIRDRNAGAVQPHSVWDQSYIRNQVGVQLSQVPVRPAVETPAEVPATTGATTTPADRYPGIRMSPNNELPPGMTVDQIFDRYRQFNADKPDPNCAPLVFQHEGKAYAAVVERANNTFRVVELEGYLDPNARTHRSLSNSDYTLLRDNYNWRNNTPAGIIAYVDKQLCLEPLTVQAEARPPQETPRVEERPTMSQEFRTQSTGVPQSYWDLPRLRNQDLEGLDRGCMNAREMTFLYDRAVATREIPNGGAMLTMLNAEDKARLGGDLIVTVRNTRTNELEHRLVNLEQHKIKIGNLTENYSPGATVRRLDDFLDTQYDAMAMVIPNEAAGTRVSQDYKRDHNHTVEDALKHLYDPTGNLRGYDRMRRDYIRGTGNEGEGGFQTRQMYRYERTVEETLPVMSRRATSEHDHAACNGEFNDRAREARSRQENDGFYSPRQLPATWGSGINTLFTFGGVLRHKFGGRDDEISQNSRDCGVSSRYDNPEQTYETPIGGPRSDRTPGVVDPPR